MIIQLGLVGPLLQVSQTIANEVSSVLPILFFLPSYLTQVQRQAAARLREHFSPPQLEQPVRSRPMAETGIEMDELEGDDIKRRPNTL